MIAAFKFNQLSMEPNSLQELSLTFKRLRAMHFDRQERFDKGEERNTSVERLLRFIKTEDADFRFELAEDHHIHTDVLDALASDSNPYVADRAQRTLKRLETESFNLLQPGSDARTVAGLCVQERTGK
jgi:hypothetical protein